MGGPWRGSRKARRFWSYARSADPSTCPLTLSVSKCRAIQERTGNRTMTKTTKQLQTASRPPVDALQYEKLALLTFRLCDQQLDQLNRLVSLASAVCRCPTMIRAERQSQRALLELLVETVEGYTDDLVRDRELYQIIALDAKGVPDSRIIARHAASLHHRCGKRKSAC